MRRLAFVLLAACDAAPAAAPVDASPDAPTIQLSCTLPSVWGYNGPFCAIMHPRPADVATYESTCIAAGTIGHTCAAANLIGTCAVRDILQFYYLGGDRTPDQLAGDCRDLDGVWTSSM